MAPPRESARKERHRRRSPIGLTREELEVRLVPAIVAAAPALPPAVAALTMNPVVTILPAGGLSPSGFTPQQIRAAYGFSQAAFGSLPANGAGQTIAIVDAYDDPGLVNSNAANFATSDLAMFDRQFGLPDPPSFTKINQYGSTSNLPGTDPAGRNSPSGNWEFEEAMDVEWAHALAPQANIVLVEANSAGFGDLYQAITTAASLPGVSTVSLSWGSSEFRGESYWDSEFRTPAGHQGVTFVAATGDAGAPGLYPAYSPNVVAAGGTSLQIGANGSYQSESAWPSSGGGTSSRESEPSYQKGVQSTGQRTIPDVAFQADRTIGVAVYDSYDNTGGGPWTTMGGTSLAAPAWAALIAVADQGRVAEGGTTLDGATQTLPALYSLPSADFHDITTGSNGTYSAGPGYDQVTGLGSPVANRLIPDLAFYGMADHLVVTAQPPASATAGSGFGLTVQVESPDGSLVTGASGTITVALGNDPGGASLGGTLTATMSGGVATFSGLSIDQAGTGYTLTVSGSGLTSATSASFDVAAAAGSQLVVAAQPPANLAAGDSFGLTVDVQDAFGNLAAGYDGTVSLSLSGSPAGSSLGGTLTASAVGGVATFSGLSIDQAGTGYTIDASAAGSTGVATQAIDVTAASASRLVVTAEPPSSLTAGGSFGLTASVEDAYGNLVTGYGSEVTIGLASGPSGASLGGTSSVAASGGVATFSGLSIDQAGSGYALNVGATGLAAVDTTSFAVTPAAPSSLVLTTGPGSSVVAGSSFGVSVSVQDAYGNPVAIGSGAVTLELLDGPAGSSLSGTLQSNLNGGAADFSGLALDRAASGYMIQASSPGLTAVDTSTFAVTPAAPAALAIAAEPPSSVTAGGGFGLTVDVQDAYGNLVTGYGGGVTVGLAGGPSDATLGGTLGAAASGGVATFSGLTIDQAGTGYTIEASDVGLNAAASTVMTVTPAAASQLVVTVQPPSTVTAGGTFGLTVAAEDPYGNLATSYDGPLAISLAGGPPDASLGGSETVSASGGVASFAGLNLTRAGLGYAIEAAGSGLVSAHSSTFDVSPAAPASLAIAAEPPASTTAGKPVGLAVAVEDAFGNLATGFAGNVSVALAGGPSDATLGGGTTVAAAKGVANFTGLILPHVGTGYVLQATSPGLADATTSAFGVLPATAARLVITLQPPSSVTAASPFGLTAAVEDAYGNVVTGDSGNLTVSLAGGVRSSLAGATTMKLQHGVGTFSSLTIDRAGAGDSLKVGASGLSAVTTSAFRVVPGAPSRLVVTTEPPGGVGAGQSFGFGVQAEDAYGNVVTTFNGPVTVVLAKGPAGSSLTGTVTTTAANGVAEFSGLTLDTAGSGYALEATSGGLSSGVTAPIAVTPAPASRLVLIAQPDGSVVRRKPFVLAVEAQDAYGNIATGFDGAVLAALTADSRHNRLVGDVAAQASGGEAVIAGARLNRPGHSYAITVTSSGLTPAATSVFSVTRPGRGSIPAARRAGQVHPHVHVHAPGHGHAAAHVRARALPSFHPRRHGR
ncbi:MAG: hypothetical protein ACYC61_08230 [Isosphaeraceae bacterium]